MNAPLLADFSVINEGSRLLVSSYPPSLHKIPPPRLLIFDKIPPSSAIRETKVITMGNNVTLEIKLYVTEFTFLYYCT